MTLLLKYKSIIKITIGLLVIPMMFLQFTSHTNQASASSVNVGCYKEVLDTSTNIPALTYEGTVGSSTCPSSGLNTFGQVVNLNSNNTCYYVDDNHTIPDGHGGYTTGTVYEQEDCTSLECQMGSSIPAGLNCSPSDPCDPGGADADSSLCSKNSPELH